MKRKFLFPLIGIFAVAVLSCQNTTQREAAADAKVDEARAELDSAKAELSNARKAATAQQLQEFREQSNIMIRRNENRIADLKAEAQQTGKKIDASYQQSIDALEQKNKDLQDKMDNFKNDTSDDWEQFQREFSHDTDELRKALSDFTVNNKK